MQMTMRTVIPHISVLKSCLSKCRPARSYLPGAWPRPSIACILTNPWRCKICTFSGHKARSFSTSSLGALNFPVAKLGRATQSVSIAVAGGDLQEDDVNELEELLQLDNAVESNSKATIKQREVGAFQQLPMVSPSYEILGSGLRRAKMVRPTKGIMNAAKRERNRGAKQLDALTKELSMPLRTYIQKFPQRFQLHPYEHSLLELTLGPGKYEETLERVDLLRKKILDFGKNCASLCAKSTTKREAGERLDEGFARLEELFKRHGKAVDDLKEIAKILRAMPVVHPRTPTLCLVGAPNVGKSSLVRILSSGKPEVCNYPFTTRGISMGHFFVDTQRFQVTDTPGLLKRPDEERNSMEKLTLAALSHLPTAVLYVHDLTGDCGTSLLDQYFIYKEIKQRFADRPWLDVVSKSDLLPPPPAPSELSTDEPILYKSLGPGGALRVSVQTQHGVEQLVQRVHTMLTSHSKQFQGNDDYPSNDVEESVEEKRKDFYSPAWPTVQG